MGESDQLRAVGGAAVAVGVTNVGIEDSLVGVRGTFVLVGGKAVGVNGTVVAVRDSARVAVGESTCWLP